MFTVYEFPCEVVGGCECVSVGCRPPLLTVDAGCWSNYRVQEPRTSSTSVTIGGQHRGGCLHTDTEKETYTKTKTLRVMPTSATAF